ncbi:MAG: TonB family protein [Saprospiraceae bacterium]|nr:TonB family protein [Saprospiraceae bacterium]
MKTSINKGDILLQKWLDGSITWQEERELEQLAKDDPMLADALEGLQIKPETDHVKNITNVKSRLRGRRERKRRGMIFYLPRMAAAAAVILGLAFGIQYFLNDEIISSEKTTQDQEQGASNKLQEKEAPIASLEEQKIEEKQEIEEQEASSDKQQAVNNESDALMEEEQATGNQQPVTSNKPPESFEKITSPTVAPKPDNPKKIAQADIPAIDTEGVLADGRVMTIDTAYPGALATERRSEIAPPSVPDALKFNKATPPQRILRGKITDSMGEALIGASVIVKGTTTGTVSDVDGNFSIKMPEGAEKLIVNYTGFQSEEVSVNQADTIAVQLDASQMALDEVVVTGHGTKKKRDQASSRISRALPEPRDGFSRLERYIRKNLNYPIAAKDNQIEGNVMLTFQIQPNGTPSDFKVLQSLGYGCDEEAIRLLREGPKWALRNRQLFSDTAHYTIEFKLKK